METTELRVSGNFSLRKELERAVDELKNAGFKKEDISVLIPRTGAETDKDTTTPGEAVVAGASTGVLVGGALTWLAGIGLITIPGIGPFLAAGPIVALLTGAGTGGIAGALIGLGFSDEEADQYARQSQSGEGLVVVHCHSQRDLETARSVLERNNARDIFTPRSTSMEERRTSLRDKVEMDVEAVKARAWAIWDHEGRPSGREKEHWMRAEREIGEQSRRSLH